MSLTELAIKKYNFIINDFGDLEYNGVILVGEPNCEKELQDIVNGAIIY